MGFGRSWALAATVVAALGCALDAGHGFGTMQPSELTAELRPGARDLGDGAFLTADGYHVRLTRATVEVAEIQLQELAGGGGGTDEVFDPTNPPEGYSLCHGGHCHHESGRTATYEEIQAELAGGTVTFEAVVTLPVDRALDLLAAETVTLDTFVPSAELPRLTLARVELVLRALHLEGTVTHPDEAVLGGESLDLGVDLPLGSVTAQVSRAVDEKAPAEVYLDATFPLRATLFDDLDFAALQDAGAVSLTTGDEPAADAVQVAVLSTPIEITLE